MFGFLRACGKLHGSTKDWHRRTHSVECFGSNQHRVLFIFGGAVEAEKRQGQNIQNMQNNIFKRFRKYSGNFVKGSVCKMFKPGI